MLNPHYIILIIHRLCLPHVKVTAGVQGHIEYLLQLFVAGILTHIWSAEAQWLSAWFKTEGNWGCVTAFCP